MSLLKRKIIIAVDGFSSCGKSSFARLIATRLNYLYLDSGAMYRSVALYAIRNRLIDKDKKINSRLLSAKLSEINIRFIKEDKDNITLLNGENVEYEIRGGVVSSVVSEISKIPEVRARMVHLQKKMGAEKGIVMDGRDIGTVVFPSAEIKIFMTADSAVRAERRYLELQEKGQKTPLDEIVLNIKQRDFHDMNRKISPLKQADDAFVLDNSTMSFEEQMIWFEKILLKKGYLAGKI